ncbi:MAG: hypothetical protein ACLGH3_02055 [Actinomycetota bacterium]
MSKDGWPSEAEALGFEPHSEKRRALLGLLLGVALAAFVLAFMRRRRG